MTLSDISFYLTDSSTIILSNFSCHSAWTSFIPAPSHLYSTTGFSSFSKMARYNSDASHASRINCPLYSSKKKKKKNALEYDRKFLYSDRFFPSITPGFAAKRLNTILFKGSYSMNNTRDKSFDTTSFRIEQIAGHCNQSSITVLVLERASFSPSKDGY